MVNVRQVFKKDNKKFLLLVPLISLILLAALIYSFRSVFLAATVNNKPISRLTLDRELERQAGRSALENLILETLINQEAKKKGISATPDEISQKIKEIEEQFKGQGQDLESLLTQQGQTKKDLEKQIKIQLIIEKVLAGQISVSDEEVKNYFEENKTYFPKGTTLESQKTDIQKQLYQQKLGEEFEKWSEKLKADAKIVYFLKL